ncbi:MAG TPA: LacI family DNA-binding transcriptional regulator [Thermoleophilaceae bacterium]|nr:LacI family DNA-binding transcriptional regulator [Thermoleophilaceae bacterium]
MTIAVQVSGVAPGVLIPNSAYFTGVLNGAAAEALALGWTLVVAPGVVGSDLTGLNADGAIVIDPMGHEPLLEAMRLRGAPVVTTGRLSAEDANGLIAIDNDHSSATRTALDHLLGQGYTRPALLLPAQPVSYLRDAEAAYKAWSRERDLKPVVGVAKSQTVGAAERAAERLLLRRNPPDAFYATGDDIATGALHAARRNSLRVPDDLGIVAGMDSPGMEDAHPPITAIDLNAYTVGRTAVAELVRLVSGGASTGDVTIEHQLVVRRSSAGPSKR